MRKTAMMMIVVGALIFALTAATALAAPGKGKGGSKGSGKNKVVMCHKGQTITVSSSSVKGHQKHGDAMGACPVAPAPAPTTPGGETTAPAPGGETTAPAPGGETTAPVETTAPPAA